jgi:hypothetical protein
MSRIIKGGGGQNVERQDVPPFVLGGERSENYISRLTLKVHSRALIR